MSLSPLSGERFTPSPGSPTPLVMPTDNHNLDSLQHARQAASQAQATEEAPPPSQQRERSDLVNQIASLDIAPPPLPPASLHEEIERGVQQPEKLVDIFIGTHIPIEWTRDLVPEELVHVGDLIAVLSEGEMHPYLSYVIRVDRSIHVSSRRLPTGSVYQRSDLKKLTPEFQQKVINQLLQRGLLSPPHSIETPSGDTQAIDVFPKMGEEVSFEQTHERGESLSFIEGQLVLVKMTPTKGRYARILHIDEQHVTLSSDDLLAPNEGSLLVLKEQIMELHQYPFETQDNVLDDFGRNPNLCLLDYINSKRRFPHKLCLLPRSLYPKVANTPSVYGIEIPHQSDDLRFLLSLVQHINTLNKPFVEKCERLTPPPISLLEKRLHKKGTEIFVCGDVHGDAVSLIGLLDLLQAEGYLNARFQCRKNFKMVFLGDYIDRGVNDIQVLILLILLTIINGDSVILLRGNHEEAHFELSAMIGLCHRYFIPHRALFEDWFKMMPLALLVACDQGVAKQESLQFQYVHFSHALFSTGIDPIALPQTQPKISYPLKTITRPLQNATDADKINKTAFERFCAKYQEPFSFDLVGYRWSDLSNEYRPSERGMGACFSPVDCYYYSQATKTKTGKIKAFIRAHQHIYREHAIQKMKQEAPSPPKTSILLTTLPTSLGSQSRPLEFSQIQAMILTVKPKAKDWEKRAIIGQIGFQPSLPPRFYLQKERKKLFESLMSQPTSNNPVNKHI